MLSWAYRNVDNIVLSVVLPHSPKFSVKNEKV